MYQQPNHSSQNPETQLFDRLGDTVTGGGWSIFKGIFTVAVKVNAMMLMVFMRKNMGIKIVNFSTYFWGVLWILIAYAIADSTWVSEATAAAQNGDPEPIFSGHWLWYHANVFYGFLIYRGIGAWINMRGRNPRPDFIIGDSVIYPLVRLLLKPLRLIDDEVAPRTFLKINEARWMQFWEPLLVVIIGYQLGKMGYTAYGNFLIISALGMALFTIQAFTNTARLRVAQSNARMVNDVVTTEPSEPEKAHVIGR